MSVSFKNDTSKHSFCSWRRENRFQASRHVVHGWPDKILVSSNTTGCGTFPWGWDVRMLQPPKPSTTFIPPVVLEWLCRWRAELRRAWIVSLTAWACFNHWGAHRAWGSGLEWSCALEETLVVYSNEHRMAKADQVSGTQYPSFSLSNAMYSSTSFPITGTWKKWWDGTEHSPSGMGSEVCDL